MSIEKVHTIIKFKQEPWLKQYVEMNRELQEMQVLYLLLIEMKKKEKKHNCS